MREAEQQPQQLQGKRIEKQSMLIRESDQDTNNSSYVAQTNAAVAERPAPSAIKQENDDMMM